jgi:signal recognition particle subunit SRP54
MMKSMRSGKGMPAGMAMPAGMGMPPGMKGMPAMAKPAQQGPAKKKSRSGNPAKRAAENS